MGCQAAPEVGCIAAIEGGVSAPQKINKKLHAAEKEEGLFNGCEREIQRANQRKLFLELKKAFFTSKHGFYPCAALPSCACTSGKPMCRPASHNSCSFVCSLRKSSGRSNSCKWLFHSKGITFFKVNFFSQMFFLVEIFSDILPGFLF